jgi:ABC-type sugar transport system ATPase subunit
MPAASSGLRVSVWRSVLLLENPTAGVDVGVRAVMYALIAEQAKQGLGVLLCSTDLEDVTSTCHRVIVIRAGQAVAVVDGTTDERRLCRWRPMVSTPTTRPATTRRSNS